MLPAPKESGGKGVKKNYRILGEAGILRGAEIVPHKLFQQYYTYMCCYFFPYLTKSLGNLASSLDAFLIPGSVSSRLASPPFPRKVTSFASAARKNVFSRQFRCVCNLCVCAVHKKAASAIPSLRFGNPEAGKGEEKIRLPSAPFLGGGFTFRSSGKCVLCWLSFFLFQLLQHEKNCVKAKIHQNISASIELKRQTI